MDKETLARAIEAEEQTVAEYGLPDWMATMTVLRLLTEDDAKELLQQLTDHGKQPSGLLSLMTAHRFADLMSTAERFINHRLRGERLIGIFESPKSLSIDEQHARYEALVEAAKTCGLIDVTEETVESSRQIRIARRA